MVTAHALMTAVDVVLVDRQVSAASFAAVCVLAHTSSKAHGADKCKGSAQFILSHSKPFCGEGVP